MAKRTVAGAVNAFMRDLRDIVGFARDLRSGKKLDEALGDLEHRAKERWGQELRDGVDGDAHASGPTPAQAREFGKGIAEQLRDVDEEMQMHRRAEQRSKKRGKRRLGRD